MYGAVFALISCAGAWAAWRRHPLYSPGATFRILAETLLLLIAAACAIAATVRLTENKSVTVRMIALCSVIVLVALTLIFSITAISTPKSAQLNTALPPMVTLVNMYRRSRIFWVSLAILVGTLLMTPGSWVERVGWAAACIAPVPGRLIPSGCDPSDLTLLRTALTSRIPAAKIAL